MKISLKVKAVVLIIAIAVILGAVSLFFSTILIKDIIDRQFRTRANDLAATVAVTIDSGYASSLQRAVSDIYDSLDNKVGSEAWGTPEFEEYVSNYSQLYESMGYKTLLESLRAIQEKNSVDCIYLLYADEPTKSAIYLVDAALEGACPIGCFDPIYEVNMQVFDDPAIGFPAYITDTEEYGWLVTAAAPVYDITGNVVCYAAVNGRNARITIPVYDACNTYSDNSYSLHMCFRYFYCKQIHSQSRQDAVRCFQQILR